MSETEQEYTYDVFLAHNSEDKPAVRAIAGVLEMQGIRTWFDEDQIPPGTNFIDAMQNAIAEAKHAAVFIGPKGLGKWQQQEYWALLDEVVNDALRKLIPVLLPNAISPNSNEIPDDIKRKLKFALLHSHVSFKEGIDSPKAIDNLLWAITGRRPVRGSYGIIVQVPPQEKQKSCFLAMPKEGLDGIYTAVKNAVQEVSRTQIGNLEQLKLIQTRRSETDSNNTFAENIKNVIYAIRSAEVVIGVCASEDGSAYLDPDVMYELGLAHALGKPLCIILNPANSAYLSEYILQDISNDELIICESPEIACGIDLDKELAVRLKGIINQLKPPYLTKVVDKDISAVRWDEVRRLVPIFRNHFFNILQFSLDIHKRFPAISKGLTCLYKEVEEVKDALEDPDERNLDREIQDVLKHWKQYKSIYQSDCTKHPFEEFLNETRKGIIEKSFKFLEEEEVANKFALSAHKYYDKVIGLIEDYSAIHNSLADILDKNEQDVCEALQRLGVVYGLMLDIDKLVNLINYLVDIWTGKMTTSLTEIICERGYRYDVN